VEVQNPQRNAEWDIHAGGKQADLVGYVLIYKDREGCAIQ